MTGTGSVSRRQNRIRAFSITGSGSVKDPNIWIRSLVHTGLVNSDREIDEETERDRDREREKREIDV